MDDFDGLEWRILNRGWYVAEGRTEPFYINADKHHSKHRSELYIGEHMVAVGRIGYLMRIAEIHDAQN